MTTGAITGLDLCARYYAAVGAPLLADCFPDHFDRIAAGLVGDGSDCFGFDDEISRDHDWGPGFCVWLTAADYAAIGEPLSRKLADLPGEFEGVAARQISVWGQGRTGVFEIGRFYKRFIGRERPPETLAQWRLIPETHLAAATNGRIFHDPLGAFTAFRDALLAFYPEDIRLKMMALRCMTMAQAGQYNYARCTARGEAVAAQRVEAQFVDAAISMVFLLNRRYKPYFKWMHRAVRNLPILGPTMFRLTRELVTCHERHFGAALARQKQALMDRICAAVARVLRDQSLSQAAGDLLLEHGPQLQARIADPQIRDLDIWAP
ncbi:MAG: DUF4037 domain-containing protein [Desulfosarcinaceae bacterium]|nr:DUF4037 domain-containing protein [Desulfosarcinaceae bacterium]